MPRRLLLPLLALLVATPLAAQDQDFFGAALTFVGDELLIVKRAPARGPAAVHRFSRHEGRWRRTGELRAPNAVQRGLALSPSIVATTQRLLVGGGDPDDAIGAYTWTPTGGEWRSGNSIAVAPVPDTPAQLTLATIMRVLQPTPRSLSANDSLVLIGMSNRAHLFRMQGDSWQRVNLDAGRGPSLGAAVALGPTEGFVAAPLANAGAGQVLVVAATSTGDWHVVDTLTAPGLTPRASALGVSLAIDGNTLAVGASGASTVVTFVRGANGWQEQQRLSPDGIPGFGVSVALRGDELLVGAPRAGTVVRYQQRAGSWTETHRLVPPADADRTSFGAALASGPRDVAVGAPNAVGGRGRVWVYPRQGPDFGVPAELTPAPGPETIVAGERPCERGASAGFDCSNVDLQSFLSVSTLGGGPTERVSDLWGWTDPLTHREYALVARTGALVFVDISAPAGPVVVAQMPANPSGARDVKVYRDHAYFVGDGAGEHGMMVFDLTRLRGVQGPPRDMMPDTVYHGIASAHNLAIDTASALAIAVSVSSGGTSCGGGLHLIDIREPKAPQFAGCFTDTEGLVAPGRTHDVQCVRYHGPDQRFRDRTICFASNETALRIVDVTNPAEPVALGRGSYPGAAYIHQGWLTDDQQHFYLDDELDELVGTTDRTRTMIWDVSDLEDPVLIGTYLGPDASTDHNLFILGNRMYQANYQGGLRVVDISNRLSPREVGHFDTTPYEGNAAGFYGAWGVYPFFPSGNVIVTSMQEGLFVLRPRPTVLP
jgi:choice-of-anchor B domain-containing protein